MKFNNIFYFLFFMGLSVAFSCTEEDPEIAQDDDMEMNDDQMDDDDDGLEAAPAFSVTTTDGQAIESSQFVGKNLVIFFFGFNCPPCKAVGPDIEKELHQKFKENDKFAIIGADQWEGNNAGVNNFQETTGISFPLGVKGASMASDFKTTYDRLVVVNADGKIVYRGNSIATNNLDEVVTIVEGLLN